MFRIILLIILILSIFISSTFGKNFHVKQISRDLQTVVIMEDESSMEWEARKGDQIHEWTIIDIQPDQVILGQEPEEDLFMETQMIITVPSQHLIMEDKIIPRK
jgi:hypothetical protein